MRATLKRFAQRPHIQAAIIQGKKAWYWKRGEPLRIGQYTLRYVPGSRPTRVVYANSDDVVTRNDARQVKYFLDNVRPGDFVLDIGANAGQYAVLFSAFVGPLGKVISFEPDPAHRSVLRTNIALNGFRNVLVEPFAASDKKAQHSFFSRANDQMSSLVRSGLGTNFNARDVREHTVTTVRLDDYLRDQGLPWPNWVKIDAEGAEVNILRGAHQLLESKAKIVCELHPYAWPEFGTSFSQFLSIIARCERSVRYLDESLKIEDGAFHGSVVIT